MKSKPGILHQLHIAINRSVGYGVTPSCLILMDIRTFEVAMLSIEEEALVRGPRDPAKAKFCLEMVDNPSGYEQARLRPIEDGSLGTPESRIGNGTGFLLSDQCLTG